jgi:hypothetical protein
MNDRCRDCRYWKSAKGLRPRVGDCCRFPPQVIVRNEMHVTQFPETFETEGCGEFKPKEQ